MDDDALHLDGSHGSILRVDRLLLHLVQGVQTIYQPAKGGVHTVQVRLSGVRDEKLAAVGVWASVHHGQAASSLVLQGRDKLVLKVTTIDALTALAGARRITTLDHESLDVSVEVGVVVIS